MRETCAFDDFVSDVTQLPCSLNDSDMPSADVRGKGESINKNSDTPSVEPCLDIPENPSIVTSSQSFDVVSKNRVM